MNIIKRISVTALITFSAAIVIYLIACIVITRPDVSDKNDGLLEIVYSGTTSMGSYAKYTISDNTVLIECEEIDRMYFPSVAIDFGWKFRPVYPGNCTIITEQWDCGDFSFAEIYGVTVDKNLNISYSKHTAERLNSFSHYMDTYTYDVSVSCDKDGETKIFSADETESFNSEIDMLYGINTDCEKPDLSGMTKIAVDYKYNNDSERRSVIYLDGTEIYYPYENYNAEYWAKFAPDELCSLDGINTLLDLKD